MVPSGDIVVDIRVFPLEGVKVEGDQVVELVLRVPTTVRVDSSSNREESVTSSRLWGVVLRLNLLPLVSVEVEGIHVVEGYSSIVNTSVTSKDIDLVVDYGG